VVELIENGYNVVILDNLHNSSTEAVRRIEAIVGKSVAFENVDLTDFEAVKAVFGKYQVESVIHFAGLKVLTNLIPNLPPPPRRTASVFLRFCLSFGLFGWCLGGACSLL
jgi:nucleoside-diphosphate-sugar epimerase